MNASSFSRVTVSRVTVALVTALLLPAGMLGQRRTGGVTSGVNTPSQPNEASVSPQPIYLSGKVLIEGGGAPPEPVVIERVCSGSARREGYTDNKGAFQVQLDQAVGFQDASEATSNGDPFNNPGNRSAQTPESLRVRYQGCEIRAVLPGFTSSSVALHFQGATWQYELGTILLTHMENAPGSTISMTTLSAPGDARHAYDKARKQVDDGKLSDAEKELNKAVKIYPNFASAWSLLGDIDRQQERFDPATKEYQQAITADPKLVNPVFGLAMIAAQDKRWADAAQLSDDAIKLNPSAFPLAFFYNAVANYNLGKIEPAEASARKFKSLDVNHRRPETSLLLGRILIQKNDFSAAAQELRDYLTLSPNAQDAEEIRQWLKRYDDANVAKQ